MTRKWLAVWFVAVLAGSLYSRSQLYHARADRCSLDGTRLIPIYRVDLMLESRIEASFCCIRCAGEWPDVPPEAYWQVRDEVTGKVMDATRGRFVQSSVVTIPSRQDSIHVFKSWVDAMNHMAEFDGTRVANPLGSPGATEPWETGDDNPIPDVQEKDEDHD